MTGFSGKCETCGASLSPQDYTLPACRYCGAAYRHHLDAAAKAAEVNAVMGGFMARLPQVGGPPGAASGAPVVVVPGMQPIVHASSQYLPSGPPLGASPPMAGGPMGGAPLGAPPGWTGGLQGPALGSSGSLRWLWLIIALGVLVPLLIAGGITALLLLQG